MSRVLCSTVSLLLDDVKLGEILYPTETHVSPKTPLTVLAYSHAVRSLWLMGHALPMMLCFEHPSGQGSSVGKLKGLLIRPTCATAANRPNNSATRAHSNQDGVPGDPITAIVRGNGPWEGSPYVLLVPTWQHDDSLMSPLTIVRAGVNPNIVLILNALTRLPGFGVVKRSPAVTTSGPQQVIKVAAGGMSAVGGWTTSNLD
ncbi:hypothetical protein EGW08_000727 [Elysia chlorotica]|uniref:Uncharacterized protein n=1 Tax=Elysia chlorotica TaxID=188477 RepID=A0A3S1BUC7_ELYCH|nr:hypothetical protein EGW08_000727 [Elysia chlorotica]